MIKFMLAAMLVFAIGRMTYDAVDEAFAEFKYRLRVEQCKSEIDAPTWANGLEDWGCRQWAK